MAIRYYGLNITNVDHKKYAKFEYESVECDNPCKLGDVVARDQDGIEIGVVLQVHDDDEVRTDMFGNVSQCEIFFPSPATIAQYRPELLAEYKDTLLDKLAEQIKADIKSGDMSAIYELMENVPLNKLVGYLPQT